MPLFVYEFLLNLIKLIQINLIDQLVTFSCHLVIVLNF